MRKIVLPLAASMIGFAAAAWGADPTAPAGAALELAAKGAQIYVCAAAGDNFAWRLKAPDAELFDRSGRAVGKHFAGPSWQAADGSTVVGEPMNVTPSPRPHAVPWLILRAKSHSGSGVMADVAFVVRMATRGGAAPMQGCDAGHAGAERRVPYEATYLFFRG